jgi:hypothetical protein
VHRDIIAHNQCLQWPRSKCFCGAMLVGRFLVLYFGDRDCCTARVAVTTYGQLERVISNSGHDKRQGHAVC